MFTPKWKKQAKLLYKGSQKFLNYKRDLLSEDRIKEINSRREDLKSSIKEGDREKVAENSKLLEKTCEQALPRHRSGNAIQENLEVFFVAIVVALGIRAYFLQPFRIPTNSMYPTLNGLVGNHLEEDKWPSMPKRLTEYATHGRSYIKLVAEKDSRIRKIEDVQKFHFFTRTVVTFDSGQKVTLSCSQASLEQVVKDPRILQGRVRAPAGTVIAEGYVDSGDLILVDKVSYHFRKPENGEVFVFDTRNIREIEQRNVDTGAPSSHYIKRLVATPGDTIELQGGHNAFNAEGQPIYLHSLIYRNGTKAKEAGILRVESGAGKYDGYSTSAPNTPKNRDYLQINTPYKLTYKPSTGKSEYWAMGDNSNHSWDSRGWGSVKEYNVVGPAFFSLWPFGSGHWGVIK